MTKKITAHGIGKDLLLPAISNLHEVRQNMQAQKHFPEAEICYQTISLLMEIDKYFAGGYLSTSYMREKCESITGNIINAAQEMARKAFGEDE